MGIDHLYIIRAAAGHDPFQGNSRPSLPSARRPGSARRDSPEDGSQDNGIMNFSESSTATFSLIDHSA